jgi:hypothetical protein
VEFLRQWIGVILILLGLMRAGVVVLAEPMAGYANQYDMHRTSACIGLFPADEKMAQAATPEAPTARYAVTSRTEGCYQSAEVIIAATAVAIMRTARADMSRFKLQWVGYVKLALLFGSAFVIAWLLRDHAAASAVHGLVVLLVLSDPVVTLWMNTLYTEFATIWSLYLVMAACCVLALYDRQSLISWALLVIGLIVLAVSREQFALLGPAMVLAAWPWLWHSSRHFTVVALVVSLVASFASLYVLPRPMAVAKANRADTYLHLLVPAASTPQRGLEILGLPRRASRSLGRRGIASAARASTRPARRSMRCRASRSCASPPTSRSRSRARRHGRCPLPRASPHLPRHPRGPAQGDRRCAVVDVLAVARVRGDAARVALRRAHAGDLHARAGGAADAARAAPLSRRSAGAAVARHAAGRHRHLFVPHRIPRRRHERGGAALPAGALAMYAAIVAALGGLGMVAMRWKENPREMPLELGTVAAALGIAGFGIVTALAWMGAQPRGNGVLDEPAGRQVPAAGFQLRGWALDPSGVESVKVRVGSLEKAAKIGEPAPSAACCGSLPSTRLSRCGHRRVRGGFFRRGAHAGRRAEPAGAARAGAGKERRGHGNRPAQPRVQVASQITASIAAPTA